MNPKTADEATERLRQPAPTPSGHNNSYTRLVEFGRGGKERQVISQMTTAWRRSCVKHPQSSLTETDHWEQVSQRLREFGYERSSHACKKYWERLGNQNINSARGKGSARTLFNEDESLPKADLKLLKPFNSSYQPVDSLRDGTKSSSVRSDLVFEDVKSKETNKDLATPKKSRADYHSSRDPIMTLMIGRPKRKRNIISGEEDNNISSSNHNVSALLLKDATVSSTLDDDYKPVNEQQDAPHARFTSSYKERVVSKTATRYTKKIKLEAKDESSNGSDSTDEDEWKFSSSAFRDEDTLPSPQHASELVPRSYSRQPLRTDPKTGNITYTYVPPKDWRLPETNTATPTPPIRTSSPDFATGMKVLFAKESLREAKEEKKKQTETYYDCNKKFHELMDKMDILQDEHRKNVEKAVVRLEKQREHKIELLRADWEEVERVRETAQEQKEVMAEKIDHIEQEIATLLAPFTAST